MSSEEQNTQIESHNNDEKKSEENIEEKVDEKKEEKLEEKVEEKKEEKLEEKFYERKEDKQLEEKVDENKEEKVDEKKEEKLEEKADEKKEEKVEEKKEEKLEETIEEKKEEKVEEKKDKKLEEKVDEKKEEKLEEKEDEKFEENDKEIMKAIKEIKESESLKSKLLMINNLNNEKTKIETNYAKEYDNIKNLNDLKYLNIYSEIQQIINGESKRKITKEESKKYFKEENYSENLSSEKIDDYWMKVIINSKYFTITEKDKKIIKYLKKIWMEKINNSINDFIIYFQFDKNEFFSNDILYKKYFFPENEEHKPKKIEVSEIKWYSEEKNPTIKKKEKRIKKGKKTFTKNINEDIDSFFSLFKNIECNNFTEDEVIFFVDDLFINQLEYYLNIRIGITYHSSDFKDDIDFDDDVDDKKNKDECKGQ